MASTHVTTTDQLPDALGKYYVAKTLYEASHYLVWYLFAQKAPYMEGNGDKVKWRRILRLDSTPKRLEQAVTNTGQRMDKVDLLMTVDWYGDHVLYSDRVIFENRDPVLKQATKVLGDQAGEMLDKVLRNVYVAGTNVLYAADDAGTIGAARSNVAGRINNRILDKAIRNLRMNRAKPWKKSIAAGPGQGTVPVRDAWPAITDAETLYDLELYVAGYRSVHEYGQFNKLHESEQGCYKNIRFFLTDNGISWNTGSTTIPTGIDYTTSNVNVHATVIFGQDAIGAVRLGGKDTPVEFIAHKPGSAGSADPLNQRGSAGWKAPQAGKILDQTQIIRVEHAVSA